jgi:hypothetical protein
MKATTEEQPKYQIQGIQALLKPEETAPILKVSVATLAYWRARKSVNLPYIVLTSGAIRYRLSAIEKFLAKRTVGEDGKVPEGVVRHVAGPGRPPKRRRKTDLDAVPDFLRPKRTRRSA